MEEVVKQLGDQLVALSSTQAADLRAYLKEAYGFEAPCSGSATTQKEQTVTVVEEVQTHFDVILKGFDPNKKMPVLKVVRAATGLGLKEVKDFIEGALPKTVKEALPKAEAEKLKKEIEDNGGQVDLK